MAYETNVQAEPPSGGAEATQAATELSEELREHQTPEYWTRELQASRKWLSKWHTQARNCERKYLLQPQEVEGSRGEFPLFWSNVETILASMYGQIPKVTVDRANLDPNDDAARVASIIIERIFNYEAEDLESSPYYVMQDCIQDRLVSGLGVAWARYEFKSEQVPIAPGLDDAAGEPVTMDVITEERCPLDYVRWEDFLYSPCRRWIDKRWMARRVPMSRRDLVKRFGPAAMGVPLALKGASTRQNRDDDPLRAQVEDQADVWEIWCLTTRTAYWYVAGHERLLDTKEDPLGLADFFPVRRPLIATHLTNAFLPRPDYIFAKSQYEEMELIAQRCTMLTEACKLVGVYDKTADGVQRMLNQAAHNQLIPVDNWAMFAEKGGIRGQVDWLPLEMVVKTLEYLTSRKMTLSTEVFELLGISDIQRGMAASRETATTQRLKAQFGSARATKATAEISRFVTDCYRMRAEIICRHWQPQTIMTVSQIDKTPDAQLAGEAVQLMKTDPTIAMRVKISAENITAPDWELEKSLRVDFLGALSGFLASASGMVEKFPGTAQSMLQIVQWVASGFKGAKSIEGVMDQALAALAADQAKPKEPPPPTPRDKKDLANAQAAHADAKKKFADAAKVLAELGLPVEAAFQLPPQYDPTAPAAPPGAPLPGAPAPPAGGPQAGPPVPAGPAGALASPPGQQMNPGGAPMRPPMAMPYIPGIPPQ
jgi:hypothetical protein